MLVGSAFSPSFCSRTSETSFVVFCLLLFQVSQNDSVFLCDCVDFRIIVKVVSDDIKDQLNYGQNHSAPPLTPTQQFLVTLVFMLQSQHEQYKALLETILLGIEYQLFRLGHVPNVSIM
jgi:hypothetical protein